MIYMVTYVKYSYDSYISIWCTRVFIFIKFEIRISCKVNIWTALFFKFLYITRLRPLYINMSGNMIYWRQIFQSFETIKPLGRAAIEKDSHLDKGTTYHRAKRGGLFSKYYDMDKQLHHHRNVLYITHSKTSDATKPGTMLQLWLIAICQTKQHIRFLIHAKISVNIYE